MDPRFRRTLARTAIVVGLLFAGLLAWSAWAAWASGGRLQARLDAIRAGGDPTSIADFGSPDRTLPDDADALLEEIADDVAALEAELGRLGSKSTRPEGSPATAEEVFSAHPDVVPRLIEAASRATYSHPFLVTPRTTTSRFTQEVADRTGRFRAMTRILASWSAVLRDRGDRDEAVAVGVAMLRLADDLGRDPGFISALGSVACGSVSVHAIAETLASGPVSEESRDALDAQLARFDGPGLLRHALATERAYSISSFREMPTAPLPFGGWLKDGGLQTVLDLYERQLETVDLPYGKAQDASRAIVAGLPWHPMRPLAAFLAPAMQSAHAAVARQVAWVRSLRVLNALQRGGLDEPPADLAALGLPAEATLDPFTEKPLIVRRLPEGWLVYSVGADLVDDGGVFDRARDAGVGPVVKERPDSSGAPGDPDAEPTEPAPLPPG